MSLAPRQRASISLTDCHVLATNSNDRRYSSGPQRLEEVVALDLGRLFAQAKRQSWWMHLAWSVCLGLEARLDTSSARSLYIELRRLAQISESRIE